MKRVLVLFLPLLFLWGCASVPIMPQTEVGPIEGNFIQTGLGASPGIVFDEVTGSYDPFPAINMYSTTRFRLIGPYDLRFTGGVTIPFGIYIGAGSSGKIYELSFLSLNYSLDMAYSGVTNHTYNSNGDTLTDLNLKSLSFIFCPNLEFHPIENSLLKLRVYTGPYFSVVGAFISDYDRTTASLTESKDMYFMGGLHVSAMVQLFRVLSIVVGVNPPFSLLFNIGNYSFSSTDPSFYIAPYIFLSLGF